MWTGVHVSDNGSLPPSLPLCLRNLFLHLFARGTRFALTVVLRIFLPFFFFFFTFCLIAVRLFSILYWMTENMKGREEEKRRSIVGENLVYSILAKELIVAKKGVDEGTTDGDRASSLFHHFSPKITESFPARLKYPTLVSSLSIILSQLNDFNRSLKSSQAPGPLVNCSSAALLRYHYVRNNFDVEWDTCFVSIADDATIIEKEKGKEKSRSTLTK